MAQEAFGLSGEREEIKFPITKDPASKRNEAGADLYTLAEPELPCSDLTDEGTG